jgi:hypothetical protein
MSVFTTKMKVKPIYRHRVAWSEVERSKGQVPRHASVGFPKWPNLAADPAWE